MESNNIQLISNWIDNGFVVWHKDEYIWTRKAKKLIPIPVRNMLVSISNGKKMKYHFQTVKLKIHGFDEKGFYREKS